MGLPWWLRWWRLPTIRETQIWSLGQVDPLEKRMTTHSSILAWRIPWTEEPNRLQSMGLQRVRHYWVTNTFTSLSRWITLTEFQMLSKFYLSVRVLQRRSNREYVCVCVNDLLYGLGSRDCGDWQIQNLKGRLGQDLNFFSVKPQFLLLNGLSSDWMRSTNIIKGNLLY